MTTGFLIWGEVVIGAIPVREVSELGTLPSSPEVRPGDKPGDIPGESPGDRDRDSWRGECLIGLRRYRVTLKDVLTL